MKTLTIDDLKAAPPRVLAIHGVGTHPKGHVKQRVRQSLSAAGIEADVEEFNWDSIAPHFADSEQAVDGLPDFLSQASRDIIAATSLGFAPRGDRYALPAVLRLVDAACFPLAATTLSLACIIALLVPPCALLAAVVFAIYAEFSWVDFAWLGKLFWGGSAGLATVGVVASILPVALSVLAIPGSGTLPVRVLFRRYGLLAISRVLLAVTLPLRLPLLTVVSVFAPFAIFFALLSLLPFSYGFFIAEELKGSWLPLKIAAGLVTLYLGGALLAAAFAFWIRGPLEVVLDIFRYLCDRDYRAGVQAALDERIRAHQASGSRPIVLYSHSLGSVIALDSLINSPVWTSNDSLLLATMGSPIRRTFVRFFPRFLLPHGVTAAARTAGARVGRFLWINAYRPFDYIGTRLGIPKELGAEVCTRQWRKLLSSHSGYWDDDRVRACMMETLRATSEPGADAVPMPPARIWIPEGSHPEGPWASLVLSWAPRVIFPLVFVGVFWATDVALDVRNRPLDQRVAKVLAEGRTYPASITHRENPQPGGRSEYDYVYTDEFVFEFQDHAGQPHAVTNTIDSWNANPTERRRYDDRKLREHVRELGTLTQEKGFFQRKVTVPSRLDGMSVRVLPEDPMFLVVPGFPPDGSGASVWAMWQDLLWIAGAAAALCAVFGTKLFRIFLGSPA